MPGADTEFVHLHLHTDHSLLDGACRIDRLMNQATQFGMKSLAITDHGNLFGLVDFYQTAKKFEINPILGCEIYLVTGSRLERPERGQHIYYHMGLLARNYTGYKNLTKLVSDAHVTGFYYKPRTDIEQLAAHAEGLIGFTGCLQGVVPQMLLHDQIEDARKWVGRFVDIFGQENYIVELQDHRIPEQKKIIPLLLNLAEEFKLKVVCTNDVHFVQKSDSVSHDVLLCIQTGAKVDDEKRMRFANDNFYLKTGEEMAHLFSELPESLENTMAVAEMCEVKLPLGENHYPVFKMPSEIKVRNKTNAGYLKELCIEGLLKRYGINYYHPNNYQPKANEDHDLANILVERVNHELEVIENTGYIDYFLIVQDFINWALNQNIPVGPGRGSGAGSLVAYLTHITDIDPIRFKLLFERFLNEERISPPDFDIDFCMRRRGEVIDYVRKKYGDGCVANIITFGTFGAKMVVRDVARVLDIPYGEADRIAKMVPDDLKITLDESVSKSSELQKEVENNKLAAKIIEHGKIIEGMVRNTGTHAAGVIISDRPLTEYVPLTLQEGALTTQYPQLPVENLGLLKMDFLGLKTLTVIADAEENIRLTAKENFDINNISFNDDKAFQLINGGFTAGVFQLESGGMRNLCRQIKISNIDEIVALIALYRPGPMEWIPDYIRGKQDPSTIKFPHPLLEEICKETYGVMVYQEQVIESAKIIAGYTLGAADILRHAMGKKKISEMKQQRAVFVKGAFKTHGIEKEKALEIFSILEKFAGYGFNKSHSAAYAILSYRTAYLKANYPVEFMAALLSSELGNADKVALIIDECAALNIPVLGPDANLSRQNFTPVYDEATGNGSIRFGLAAMRGVGDAAASKIIEEREINGVYRDFYDFTSRIDSRSVNRRVLECLIKSGAFDYSGHDRGALLENLDGILNEMLALQRDREHGQESFFNLLDLGTESSDRSNGGNGHNDYSRLGTNTIMPLFKKLKYEKELLGFYVSGHPMNGYKYLDIAIDTIKDNNLLVFENRSYFRLCGVVSNISKKISRRDKRPWAILSLGTRLSTFTINIYADAFSKYNNLLVDGELLMVTGIILKRNDDVRLSADFIQPLEQSIPDVIKKICWVVRPDVGVNDFLDKLKRILEDNYGDTQTEIGFLVDDNHVVVTNIAGSLSWKVGSNDFLKLRQHPSIANVEIETNIPYSNASYL